VTTLSWVLIAAWVLVVIGLVVLAFLIGRRAPRRSAPAHKPHSPAQAWREVVRSLPSAARSLPVIVVVGERGSGKSRLIRSVFGARTGFAGDAITARDDLSVSAFAPGHVLVQEIAGELFETEGIDGIVQLHELWQPMALEIALVVFVGTASGSPDRHAQRVRRILDLLTDLRRGSAPRCSLCVTRLDETTEGFAELVGAAQHAGSDTQSPFSVSNAADLRAIWDDRFRDCYYAALGALPASGFIRAARFPEKGGPDLARYVDALLRGIARGRSTGVRTLLALAALPENGATALLGDPFAPDDTRLELDRRALERRRALRSAALVVAACGVIVVLYGWHQRTLRRAESAVSAFGLAAARAKSVERKLWGAITAEPEAQAASAIDAALGPLYLPLRLAFPREKDGAVKDLLRQIRGLHLEPLTRAPDRATRVYAASLLYATRDGPLGRTVRAEPQRWSSALDMPVGSVQHYVGYSVQPWPGSLSAGEFADRDIATPEWAEFFDRLDRILERGKLERPGELTELRSQAERLNAAMRWAVQEPELRSLIQLLELERGKAEVETLLGGKNAALLQAPAWVVAQRESLQAVLAMVNKGEVAVPTTTGKSLRNVLADLDAIGVPAGAEGGPARTLEIDGKAREYKPEAWARLLAESRSTFYVGALLEELFSTPRSLFFVDPQAYPDVPASPVLGRGPSATIAGMFTAAAFKTEIREPLDVLDGKLEAARVPSAQRDALKAAIQRELDAHATGLANALSTYLKSFRFDANDAGSLRAYMAEMVSGASWFAEFWAEIARAARVDAGGNVELRAVHAAVSAFAPITVVMTEDKGAYPNLQPYTAILAKILPSLADDPLVGDEPRTGALVDRLSPIGKLGLALLDSAKPGPLQEVDDWLTKSNVLDEQLRQPFRAPVLAAYEQALRAVEHTVATAYTNEMRPLVLPLFAQFPFDPGARTDAVPAEVQGVLGPKGRFLTLFQDVYAPVTVRDERGEFHARKAAAYRSLVLSREALGLGRWANTLSTFLWGESGAPRAIPLAVRPVPSAKIATGAVDAPTLAVLRSGATTVAAFNQATTWKLLPVEWWSASPAALGLEFMSVDGKSRRALSAEASGPAWRFFRLLRRGSLSHGVVRWSLERSTDREVAFELRSDPWEVLVPPLNQDRFCVLESPWDQL
jgi:hypothetical protein